MIALLKRFCLCFLVLSLIYTPSIIASVDVVKFDSPQKEALYNDLINELRCLVCQNQTLADSNADLAIDLRKRTQELVESGKSRREITDYMVTRYGEYILYRPPLNTTTLLLWFAPLALFAFVLWLVIRRRLRSPAQDVFDITDHDKAKALLSDREPPH